jgi:hypothetical protein
MMKKTLTIAVNALITIGMLSFASLTHAAIIELNISASWQATDYDVSASPIGLAEEDDDKVFGMSPSSGSINFILQVDTSTLTSFMVGGAENVEHNHFGYTGVTLKAPVTLGSATWTSSDIIDLNGPGGAMAALWTDVDLTSGAPSLMSFRMQGSWVGASGSKTADLFFGSRSFSNISGYKINSNFQAAEYFEGEKISNSNSNDSRIVNPVSESHSALLVFLGLAGLGFMRKKKG